jgi:uncharacterized membrane protein YkvA (DUF1232 family)
MSNAAVQDKSSGNKIIAIAGDPFRLAYYLAKLLKDNRVPRSAKLKLLGSGLYAWIDGDIIPDPIRFVPGLGYVDDVILVVHGIKCLISETEPRVAAELWPGDEASFRRTMTAVAWLDDQLFERVRGWVTRAVGKLMGNKPDLQEAYWRQR